MVRILRHDETALVASLVKEVERLIVRNEEQYKRGVLRDFHNGLARRQGAERVRWCNRWRQMYRDER